MTEKQLNNCLILHVHKDTIEELNLQQNTVQFVSVNDERNILAIINSFNVRKHSLSSFIGIYIFDIDLQTYPRAVQVGIGLI